MWEIAQEKKKKSTHGRHSFTLQNVFLNLPFLICFKCKCIQKYYQYIVSIGILRCLLGAITLTYKTIMTKMGTTFSFLKVFAYFQFKKYL